MALTALTIAATLTTIAVGALSIAGALLLGTRAAAEWHFLREAKRDADKTKDVEFWE